MRSYKAKSGASKGFTLIELLIVIGIIGFLAAAVLVAVDPVKRIQDARDSRRYSEANALLNAILNKQVDDRKVYNGHTTAPIITSAAFSQVIVTNDVGIECDTDLTENFPGCNQALDVGATPSTSKSCVANLGDTGAGAGTAASSSPTVNGTGTLFISQVSVGDTLVSTTSGGTCTVQSITNDTTLVCTGTPSPNFAGVYTITHAASAVAPNYIASLPIDPRGTGSSICNLGDGCATSAVGVTSLGLNNTGYYIHRTNGNRIEVGACSGEQTSAINVKR